MITWINESKTLTKHAPCQWGIQIIGGITRSVNVNIKTSFMWKSENMWNLCENI